MIFIKFKIAKIAYKIYETGYYKEIQPPEAAMAKCLQVLAMGP
jgi:hypothetical protein